MNQNPNELLAVQITKELLRLKLIDPAAEKKFTQAIGQGTLRESDWKLYLEEEVNKQNTPTDEAK
ncbi:hypothetical protein Q4E93_33545 [Flavitalea sp. BT771]|uniref:hypothetical protein n=1 Tax=Flavitalea sp. BT771 TaxID=3063329 RepID=UPI0026E2F2B4|nr:hypothetical protein [Flavitalea sp. BT771]MDO6435587.1 hypothetical protein [Flavitalea sp. BT771]MDV6224487.1 hypothetical protein [Flavitalea sp. BT771]